MKDAITTDKAPAAIGPYSQAIASGELVFTSGQLGVLPDSGEFAGTTAAEQAEQALKNLGEVLASAGSSFSGIVKVTVFLADITDFASVNEVYARYFPEPFPARSCIQAAALPKNALVEIEAIATIHS